MHVHGYSGIIPRVPLLAMIIQLVMAVARFEGAPHNLAAIDALGGIVGPKVMA